MATLSPRARRVGALPNLSQIASVTLLNRGDQLIELDLKMSY